MQPETPKKTKRVIAFIDGYNLYHSRGPTVETKKFKEEDNHPFQSENWIVAHNGIISNFNELHKRGLLRKKR